MAHWLFKIDFTDQRKRYRAGEITIQQLAQVVVGKLKPIHDRLVKRAQSGFGADDYSADSVALLEIIESFEYVGLNAQATEDDFDESLARLYDWGDSKSPRGNRYLWIEPS